MIRTNPSTQPWIIAAAIATPLVLAGCDPRMSIELPGDDIYPEGIAIDDGGRLFVGSLTDGTIFRVTPSIFDSTVEVFSSGMLTRGAVGMAVDDACMPARIDHHPLGSIHCSWVRIGANDRVL